MDEQIQLDEMIGICKDSGSNVFDYIIYRYGSNIEYTFSYNTWSVCKNKYYRYLKIK